MVFPFIHAQSATLGRGNWGGGGGGGTLTGTLTLLPFALFSSSPPIFCTCHAGYAECHFPVGKQFSRALEDFALFSFREENEELRVASASWSEHSLVAISKGLRPLPSHIPDTLSILFFPDSSTTCSLSFFHTRGVVEEVVFLDYTEGLNGFNR